LFSEISRLLDVIVHHKKFRAECIEQGNTDIPLVNFSTDVYDTLLKNWGGVYPRYSARVAGFYGHIGFLNRFQATRRDYPPVKFNNFDGTNYEALNNLIINFDYMFNDVIRKFSVEMSK